MCFVPAAALAQANACEQLKATLAARIEASGVRGYALEIVPAATPVPPGAKAIGNCEGGERKVLYRRWAGAATAASASAAVAPVPAPRRLPPVPRAEVPAAAAAPAPPAPRPVVMAEPTVPPVERATAVDAAPMSVPTVAPETPAPTPEPLASEPGLPQQVLQLATAHWRWLLVLLVLPLLAWAWAWRAHRLAYDKNGLPRGPRL